MQRVVALLLGLDFLQIELSAAADDPAPSTVSVRQLYSAKRDEPIERPLDQALIKQNDLVIQLVGSLC